MTTELDVCFQFALDGYGNLSSSGHDAVMSTEEVKDFLDSDYVAGSVSEDDLFKTCLDFLTPVVSQHYALALKLKLKEKKNDFNLLHSFFIAFYKFMGNKFDKDKSNVFVGLCTQHFHKSLDKLALKYYPYNDFGPSNFGPNQSFEYSAEAKIHYDLQIKEMEPEQRALFMANPSVLPLELQNHNDLTTCIVERMRFKIDEALRIIHTSPHTPDMLLIMDKSVDHLIKSAVQRVFAVDKKEKAKAKELNPIVKTPRLKKSNLEDEIDSLRSDVSELTIPTISCDDFQYNESEEHAVPSEGRVPLLNDEDAIQNAVDTALDAFKPVFDRDSGMDHVIANRDIDAGAEFQLIGDRFVAKRDLHVKLKHGIQVSKNEYIVPPLVSTRYSVLSVESNFMSLFAHCQTTVDLTLSNATVDRDGKLTVTRPLHKGEELLIHNAHVSPKAIEAHCSQLASDLTGVIFNELLFALEKDSLTKRRWKADCRKIQEKIKTHTWPALLNLSEYSRTVHASDNDLALCDIVDTVAGKYKCEGFFPGQVYNGYEHFPAWKRHLNFQSLREVYNVKQERGVWRFFGAYLKYHRLLQKRNIYCVGVSVDPDILRYYSSDCEFLLKLPRIAVKDNDDKDDDNRDDNLKRKASVNAGEESPSKRISGNEGNPTTAETVEDDNDDLLF